MILRLLCALLPLLALGCQVPTAEQPRQRAPKASASRSLGGDDQAAQAPRPAAQKKHADFAKKLTALQAPKPAATPAPASAPAANTVDPTTGAPRGPPIQQIPNVKIENYGDVIYQGPIDLRPTVQRILAGERDPHPNDGAMFRNREGLLPRQSTAYYREYVHRTAGLDGPGPQRIVVGRGGEWYYTPDHYKSFVPLQ